jgi:hypothetical protein
MTIPFFDDQIEVLKDNLPDLAPQGWSQPVRPGFFDFVEIGSG